MNTQSNSSNKETSVEQGDRLIAEFMGARIVASAMHPYQYAEFKDEKGFFEVRLDNLQYHSSWDWLIPVIDDIYYSRRFPTGVQTTEISSLRYRLWKDIEKGLLHLSIDQTWQAVVKFIDFHNSRKPVEAIKAATQTIAEGVEILNSVMNDAESDTTAGDSSNVAK